MTKIVTETKTMIQMQKKEGEHIESMSCGKCITCTNNVRGNMYDMYSTSLQHEDKDKYNNNQLKTQRESQIGIW